MGSDIGRCSFHTPHACVKLYMNLFIGICSACRMLYGMVRKHQSTAIISKGSCSHHVSGGFPVIYPGSSAQQRCKCSSRISARTVAGLSKALSYLTGNRLFYIRSCTWDECSYPQLMLLWGLSDQRIVKLCFVYLKSRIIWVCLGVNPLDMPITPYLK